MFGPDGEDNENFEIGAIPKWTTGSISRPMEPKSVTKGDALTELIENCIVDKGQGVKWDDIKGLEEVKWTLMETIIYP